MDQFCAKSLTLHRSITRNAWPSRLISGDMATGAADGCLRSGSISGSDSLFDRRPYHKNCRCALHGSKNSLCSHGDKFRSVNYPIRRSWSEGSLALASVTSPSPGSSPAPTMEKNRHRRLGSCTEFEEE